MVVWTRSWRKGAVGQRRDTGRHGRVVAATIGWSMLPSQCGRGVAGEIVKLCGDRAADRGRPDPAQVESARPAATLLAMASGRTGPTGRGPWGVMASKASGIRSGSVMPGPWRRMNKPVRTRSRKFRRQGKKNDCSPDLGWHAPRIADSFRQVGITW